MAITSQIDHVVLLDQSLRPSGDMAKDVVHHTDTPLHLAVSCYLFDENRFLFVSQRSRKKLTWPGAITNSACGHPLPGESLHAAARRVVRRELGCDIDNIITVLPHFRYRAVSAANIVEWEYCPVIAATVDSAAIRPNPDEVEGGMWLSWPSFVELTTQRDALGLSPWCKLQTEQLHADLAPYEIADRTHELPNYLH